MEIRIAGMQDIPVLIEMRLAYLREDKGKLTEDEARQIEDQLAIYLPRHLKDTTFIGLLAVEEGRIVGTAYLVLSEMPANPSFLNGRTATVMNVFVHRDSRKRGIATKLMEALILEAERLEVTMIELSATREGRPLYEKLGFSLSSYTGMSLKLTNTGGL